MRVFAVAGQSNGIANDGKVTTDPARYETEHPAIVAWNESASAWQQALADPGGGVGASVGQWFAHFARKAWDNNRQKVAYVGDFQAGTTLPNFLPATGWYTGFVAEVAAAGVTPTDFIFWQGESDDAVSAVTHQSRLESLISGLRSEWGAGLRVWLIQIPKDACTLDTEGAHDAIAAVAASDPLATLIETTDEDKLSILVGDGCHFERIGGYKTVGESLLYAAVYG